MKVIITHLTPSPRPWPYHSPGAQIRLLPGESAEVTDTYAAEYRRDAKSFGEWLVDEANKGQDQPRLKLDIITDDVDEGWKAAEQTGQHMAEALDTLGSAMNEAALTTSSDQPEDAAPSTAPPVDDTTPPRKGKEK